MSRSVCSRCLTLFNGVGTICPQCLKELKEIKEYIGLGFYVYEYIRLDTNDPFYVWYGKNSKGFKNINTKDKILSTYINELDSNNIQYCINIVEKNIKTEDIAEMIKNDVIDNYIYNFGYDLVNVIYYKHMTKGEKMSLISKELWKDEDYRKRVTKNSKASLQKKEVRQKISEKSKNLWEDEEYRNKVTTALKRPRKKKIARVINNETNEVIYEVEGISNLQSYMSKEMGIGDKKWRKLKKNEIVDGLRIEIE